MRIGIEAMARKYRSWAVVNTFTSTFDAQFACSLLRSAGIETVVSNDLPGARNGGVTVSVRDDDLPEARQILHGLGAGRRDSVSDDVNDAARVGFLLGAICGGFLGLIIGWFWTGIVIGTAVGIVVARRRWHSQHPHC
jgi:hypothetical protein